MTVEITFPAAAWAELRTHLLGLAEPGSSHGTDEQMALLLAGPSMTDGATRLVVRELLLAQPDDLTQQSGAGIAPTGEFVARALTRCRQEGWSLIEVHSHPFSSGPSTTFSGIDWANDRAKMPVLAKLLPETVVHATMVIGQASLDAHYYDRRTTTIHSVARVTVLGSQADAPLLTKVIPTQAEVDDSRPFLVPDRHSRQIPLLGSGTQAVLAQSKLAIVGLGGLGAFTALECAHLGVGALVLIDPDTVEMSNLNRLVGASETDIGRPKVEVYANLIRTISPRIELTSIPASVLTDDALQAAKEADLLLGCVDSHGARLVMNQLAVQYVIPYIDAGSGARLEADELTHAGGQVQLVLPGLGCLECRGFIDVKEAAFDLAPPHVRQRELDHGYGTRDPAPSVVFLNGVVASLQVAQAVSLLGGIATRPHGSNPTAITLYDLLRQSLTRATVEGVDNCPTCGSDGVTALADLSPLQAATTAPAVLPPMIGARSPDA